MRASLALISANAEEEAPWIGDASGGVADRWWPIIGVLLSVHFEYQEVEQKRWP